MKVALLNLSTLEVPLVCTQGEGFVVTLEPGASHLIDDDEVTVITIGDNPTLREDLKDFVEDVADAFVRLVTFWRQHAPKAEPKMMGAHPAPVVKLKIDNQHAAHGLRVMPGDDRAKDFELQPGETSQAIGLDYIELRELGVGEAEDSTDQAG